MNRPSADQSDKKLGSANCATGFGSPTPTVDFSKIPIKPLRSEENAIRPSGDHVESKSPLASLINGDIMPRATSPIQISKFVFGFRRLTAIFLPSGDRSSIQKLPGLPNVPLCFPERSNQTNWLFSGIGTKSAA